MKTHFGFKQVDRGEKANLVKEVFSGVAKKYDLMNDLMSAGIHRIWKNEMVKEIQTQSFLMKESTRMRDLSQTQSFLTKESTRMRDLPPIRGDGGVVIKLIDVAGGTGDIAFRIAKKNPRAEIDVVDVNQEMLDVGKARAIDLNLFSKINFTCCDGENLCFDDKTFDFFTIAFGIRNFTNIDKALLEAYRVLKPGGKFICLEFSKVNDYFLQKIYDFYSFKAIPKIGEIVLNDRASYQYLVESIRKFPPQKEFKKMIEKAGFKNVSYRNLSFGIAAIHTGTKLDN
ncbi:MAG: hypothetical protein A2794_04880 [Alphaproteobacteria bacterium RIFCSPHIGHO2_01_FULL_40_8]|nr:MAG: hypothetical protein A2794_04880 [Alphaproteobacteria bacterium RIFCSPHIGHO2_01_FULL_40_8]